jgi:hypothetical protein
LGLDELSQSPINQLHGAAQVIDSAQHTSGLQFMEEVTALDEQENQDTLQSSADKDTDNSSAPNLTSQNTNSELGLSAPFTPDLLSSSFRYSSPIAYQPAAKPRELRNKEAFDMLEHHARRQFIASLDNRCLTWPVERTFEGMLPSHPTYTEAVQKVRELYKTWKNRSLELAERHFHTWLLSKPRDEEDWQQCIDFKRLRSVLTEDFDPWWVLIIFPWANVAVSYDDCTKLGKYFLKCKLNILYYIIQINLLDCTIQLIVRARLTALHRTKPRQLWQLARYDREFLLQCFDDLHNQHTFKGRLSINDFPPRRVPVARMRVSRKRTDINGDSDGEPEDKFSGDSEDEDFEDPGSEYDDVE